MASVTSRHGKTCACIAKPRRRDLVDFGLRTACAVERRTRVRRAKSDSVNMVNTECPWARHMVYFWHFMCPIDGLAHPTRIITTMATFHIHPTQALASQAARSSQ